MRIEAGHLEVSTWNAAGDSGNVPVFLHLIQQDTNGLVSKALRGSKMTKSASLSYRAKFTDPLVKYLLAVLANKA